MWEIQPDGLYAENKRQRKALEIRIGLYCCPFNFQDALIDYFDTVEEAKQKLADIVRRENAERNKDPWHVDAKGNAHNSKGRIFRTRISVDDFPYDYLIVKYLDGIELLGFASGDADACNRIKYFVDKLNDPDTEGDD